MRNHRVFGSLLVVTAVLASSCGGGGGGSKTATKSRTTTTTAVVTTTTAAPVSTDPAMLEKAKAAVYQATDFEAGWAAQPVDEGLDLEIIWKDILECTGVPAGPPALGIATALTFKRGLATQTRSTVEYTTEPAAQAIGAAFAGPKFTDCATKAFAVDAKRNAPDGGKPGPVTVAPLDFPKQGQSSATYRITNAMNLGELQVPLTQDLLVFFNGGTVIRMLFLNPGGPFPPDLERALAEKVVGRS